MVGNTELLGLPPRPLNSSVRSGRKNLTPVASIYSWTIEDIRVVAKTAIV